MSKYTTELRYICEMKSGFTPEEIASKTPDEIIAASRESIFDFLYPLEEPEHKPILETKILKEYYTREICCETVARWKLHLNTSLNLIMPKYNKLYAAEKMALRKELYNVDVTTTYAGTDDSTKGIDSTRSDNLTETRNVTDAKSGSLRDRFSDTPQGTVANVDNDSYLTDYRYTTSNDSDQITESKRHTGSQGTETDETAHSENTYEQIERGYRGSKTYLELMNAFNERVLNIDAMIVRELSDLFMKIW